MKKLLISCAVVVLFLVVGFFVLNRHIYNEKQGDSASDYKNAEYVVDGARVKLNNGVAETEAAPGSASKVTTRYFGNELATDLNGDGRNDVVFLLTQQTGGSGTFYYVVAALNTERGYVGSEGFLLGDRIAPQTTQKKGEKIIVVNYADRAPGQGFSVQPSVGKTVWLLLDPSTMQFGQVEQNFEGEADPARMNLQMQTWKWVRAEYNDGRVVVPKKPGTFGITFLNNGTFSATTDCNGTGGNYTATKDRIAFSSMVSTLMFCEGSQEADFTGLLQNTTGYHFTSRGELIFDLKFDSGSVIFK